MHRILPAHVVGRWLELFMTRPTETGGLWHRRTYFARGLSFRMSECQEINVRGKGRSDSKNAPPIVAENGLITSVTKPPLTVCKAPWDSNTETR